jgi:hypothetical protein
MGEAKRRLAAMSAEEIAAVEAQKAQHEQTSAAERERMKREKKARDAILRATNMPPPPSE